MEKTVIRKIVFFGLPDTAMIMPVLTRLLPGADTLLPLCERKSCPHESPGPSACATCYEKGLHPQLVNGGALPPTEIALPSEVAFWRDHGIPFAKPVYHALLDERGLLVVTGVNTTVEWIGELKRLGHKMLFHKMRLVDFEKDPAAHFAKDHIDFFTLESEGLVARGVYSLYNKRWVHKPVPVRSWRFEGVAAVSRVA